MTSRATRHAREPDSPPLLSLPLLEQFGKPTDAFFAAAALSPVVAHVAAALLRCSSATCVIRLPAPITGVSPPVMNRILLSRPRALLPAGCRRPTAGSFPSPMECEEVDRSSGDGYRPTIPPRGRAVPSNGGGPYFSDVLLPRVEPLLLGIFEPTVAPTRREQAAELGPFCAARHQAEATRQLCRAPNVTRPPDLRVRVYVDREARELRPFET